MAYSVTVIDEHIRHHPALPKPAGDYTLYADHHGIAAEHMAIIEEILAIFRDCDTKAALSSDTELEDSLVSLVKSHMSQDTNPTWDLLMLKKHWANVWYGDHRARNREQPSYTPFYLFCAVVLIIAFTVAVSA